MHSEATGSSIQQLLEDFIEYKIRIKLRISVLVNIMTQLKGAKFLHHVKDGYHMLPLPGVVLHPGGEGLGGRAGVSLNILVSGAGRLVMIILVTSAWFLHTMD